jgi:hypothetical protein
LFQYCFWTVFPRTISNLNSLIIVVFLDISFTITQIWSWNLTFKLAWDYMVNQLDNKSVESLLHVLLKYHYTINITSTINTALFMHNFKFFNEFYLFIYIIHLFVCSYIVWVISPFLPSPTLLPPLLLTSKQNLFCPYL